MKAYEFDNERLWLLIRHPEAAEFQKPGVSRSWRQTVFMLFAFAGASIAIVLGTAGLIGWLATIL